MTVGAIGFVLIFGRFLSNPILRFIAGARLRELFTVAALMIVVGIALLMSLVGLSPALGTFIAGVVLANSEFRHELESDIGPFRSLLLGLFFMTVGAGINFVLLFGNLIPILALSFGLIALKLMVLYSLGRLFRLEGSDKWLFGLGLAQAGEFGFVLISFTVASNVVPAETASYLSLIVAISMLVTPLLFILYDQVIAPRYAEGLEREADTIEEKGDVIIAGYGRFGGIINRILSLAGYKTVVIDYSADQLEMLRAFGAEVYFGDATRPDLLHAAGIENAKMLVVAIDDKERITELVEYVLKRYPHVHVLARAIDRPHVYDLWYAGCRDIIRENYDSSLRAGRSGLEAMGVDHDDAIRMVKEFEVADRKMTRELAPLYDPTIPSHRNEAFVKKVREEMEEIEEQLRGQWGKS